MAKKKKLFVPDKYADEKVKPITDDVDYKSAFVKEEDRFLDPKKLNVDIKERLPKPTGWRLIVVPYQGKAKSDGGIFIPDKVREQEALATTVCYVLSTGPDCYQDKNKFPNGDYCKEGDWVLIARYAGTRVKLEDFEVRILNDDEILATVLEPSDVKTF